MDETPKKPLRGAWHEQARELRAKGVSYHEIGTRLGVSGPAVYFLINPGRRWAGKKKAETTVPASSSSPAE